MNLNYKISDLSAINDPVETVKAVGLLKNCSYISGQWLTSEKSFLVENPASAQIISEVFEVNTEQLELAIHKAQKSQKEWASMSIKDRFRLLGTWHQLILENLEPLACLMTLEQGKILSESRGEVAHSASYIEWFNEEMKRVDGDLIPSPSSDRRLMCIKQPVGVVAAITPWNYPSGMITRKAAPALAAGCSIIIKPSELTPLSALALAELADRAKIPPGVFNVVTCSEPESVGHQLITHPVIRKLSFTGSTQVGKKLLKKCADTVKNVSLELGGNAPFIIFNDADLEEAVEGVMKSKFRNAGQTCVAANRIMVQKDIHEAFICRLKTEINKLVVDEGFNMVSSMGPLIDLNAVKKVQHLVQTAISEGARKIAELKVNLQNPLYYPPTLLVDVTMEMKIAREEIFGPVASVLTFETEEEAIAMANDTPYGLASYFYTNNMQRIWRLSEALDFGMVGVNEGILTSVQAPFGGIKESGLGREGSKYGLDEYLEKKYLCLGGL